MTTQVKFFIFKSHTKNTNVSVGAHGMVSFLNHEAFVQDNKRNQAVLEILNDYVENDPVMGVYIDPENKEIEIDPTELAQIQREKELQLFLAERNRRIDGGNYDPRFKPTGSDVSALTKGVSAPAPRFQQVAPQQASSAPVASVSQQVQLDADRKTALQQSIAAAAERRKQEEADKAKATEGNQQK